MANPRIKVAVGRTFQLQQFESVRIDVQLGVDVPVKDDKPSKQELDKVYDRVRDWVTSKVEQEEAEWKT